jgi:hypothetical protein
MSKRLSLELGKTGRGATMVCGGMLWHSMANKADRAAVRQFATKLLALCNEYDPREVSDPAHCSDCGYLDAECRCPK